jgi:hypothetical protein
LNSHITSKENPFLSKDESIPSSSIFKGKDSFSDLYTGKEWDMVLSLSKPACTPTTKTFQLDLLKSQDAIPKVHESVDWSAVLATAEALAKDSAAIPPPVPPKPAPFADAFKSEDWSFLPDAISANIDYSPDMFEDAVLEEPEKPFEKKNVFHSRDWAITELLETNDDIALTPEMFEIDELAPIAEAGTPAKTDWGSVFMSQISPAAPSAVDSPPKKKRKRKKRKKVVPEHKEYVNISDLDVLLGRGGRSNHHPGNKRYREEVTAFRRVYSSLDTDKEKTEMSQLLVDVIQKAGGRFLEEEKDANKESLGWYVIPNIVARRKASQALREDNNPEKRKAKRARFLAKKQAAENLY